MSLVMLEKKVEYWEKPKENFAFSNLSVAGIKQSNKALRSYVLDIIRAAFYTAKENTQGTHR